MRAIIRFLRDNSLSLVFFLLFSGSIIGQSFSGASAYNKHRSTYGFPEVDYWQYLESGDFLDGVFVNWQAAVLQLGCLVVFAKFLRQRGASHSRKPEDSERRYVVDVPQLSFARVFLGFPRLHRGACHLWSAQIQSRSYAGAPSAYLDRAIYSRTPILVRTFQTWQADFCLFWS